MWFAYFCGVHAKCVVHRSGVQTHVDYEATYLCGSAVQKIGVSEQALGWFPS